MTKEPKFQIGDDVKEIDTGFYGHIHLIEKTDKGEYEYTVIFRGPNLGGGTTLMNRIKEHELKKL